jgi:cysteinyl-tRNA synthetase
MKDMIAALYAADIAYVAEDHVLFSVAAYGRMKDVPAYGSLARRSLDEMIAGARVEVAPYKRDAMDFVLWKPSKEGEPGWPSPLNIRAPGRPGWHLECSAMSKALLGDQFDIHGGGIDLVFPHHENEVAQSCAANHTPTMANFWMHNGFLQVEGQKMSKSLGNFITIRDVLSSWRGYGWPGEAVRFAMLQTHYRQPIDWTFETLDKSHRTLWDWYGALEGVKPAEQTLATFIEMLSDDMNTPAAISELYKLFNNNKFPEFLTALNLIGLSGRKENIIRNSNISSDSKISIIGAEVAIQGQEVAIRESWNEEEINTLIFDRLAARKAKNWAKADRIRDKLAAMGIALKDAKDPETGEIVTTWEIAR